MKYQGIIISFVEMAFINAGYHFSEYDPSKLTIVTLK